MSLTKRVFRRARDPDGVTEPVASVPAAINTFAFNMYETLCQDNGDANLLFSPLSISTVLSMAQAGARGSTQTQIAEVLHTNQIGEGLHEEYGELVHFLRRFEERELGEIRLGNSVWADKRYTFLDSFVASLQAHYDSIVRPVDFARETERIRSEINRWVDEKTKHKITDIMAPGSINGLTRLILVNALYFRSKWDSVFKPEDTEAAPFFHQSGEQIEVPMMRQNGHFGYFRTNSEQILEMPYLLPFSMFVVLPKVREGLPDLEQRLNPELLRHWQQKVRSPEVEVYLPKFRIEAELQLTEILRSIGMTTPFDAGSADFSGMATRESMGKLENLFLSDVMHKTFIAVDERGTEAAAATAGMMATAALNPPKPKIFRADHPFLFFVTVKKNGAILFMGRVMDPS